LRLYYITDRKQLPGDAAAQRRHLLNKIAEAARCGVDYIQLREKDLSPRELETFAHEALHTIQLTAGHRQLTTALLINSRVDIAMAAGADGVHLRAEDISPIDVRAMWDTCNRTKPLVAVSCHSEDDAAGAESSHADFIVFAPVFEKKTVPGTRPAGLEQLRRACQHRIPVLALGGVTLDNAQSCLEAGAAGIAAIRLFQENDIRDVVQRLRP